MIDQQPVETSRAEQLLSAWLDDERQLSTTAIQQRGWCARVVADFINPMEAEWLAEAIAMTASSPIVGVGFEYQGVPECVAVKARRDDLLRYLAENSWRALLISSERQEFIYFKDEANRYAVVAGPPSFVTVAYKCSQETARMMFVDWAESKHFTEVERGFLLRVWEKYETLA